MATLPTTAIGDRNAGLSDANTSLVGTEPVLELIASPDDADFVQSISNSTVTAVAAFELGDMPGDFGTMDTLAVQLRYAWTATPSGLLTWNNLTAQVVDSAGTALTNVHQVAGSITTTTKTNSAVIPLNTGLNTTANKATWDGAVVLIRFQTTRSMAGDAGANPAVYAGEITGTYTEGAASFDGTIDVTQDDQTSAASGTVVDPPTTIRVSQVYLEAPEGFVPGTLTWSVVGTPAATTARVKARLADATTAVLKVSTASDLSAPVYTSSPVAPDAIGFIEFNASGLAADTDYHYGIEVDSEAADSAKNGTFHTLPAPGTPHSFTVAHSHCHLSTSEANTPALAHINDVADPLMFFFLGDFDYADHDGSDAASIRSTYDSQWGGPNLRAVARSRWYVSTWDDHDFGGNNSDGTLTNKTTRSAEWQRYFPADVVDDTTNGAIYHSFVIGRVRFIVLDERYYSSPNAATDDGSKTVLGSTQKTWLFAEFQQPEPLKVLVHSRPWHAPQVVGEDDWGGYTTERTEIADEWFANGVGHLLHLSGDMHGLAATDEAEYTTGGVGDPQWVFVGGAVDQAGSYKGGTYDVTRTGATEQVDQGDNHYGLLSITDNGPTIDIAWEGRESNDGTTHAVTVPTDFATNGALTASFDVTGIFPTVLTSGEDGDSQSTPYTTASIDPTTGPLILDMYLRRATDAEPIVSSITGCGLTWTQIGEGWHDTSGTSCRMYRFLGVGTPSSGAISINLGGVTHDGAGWIVSQWANVDSPTDPIVEHAAVDNVATVDANNVGGNTIEVTLPAAPTSGNVVVTAVSKGGFGETPAVADHVLLAELQGVSEDESLTLWWDPNGADTTQTASWGGITQKATITAVEFAPAVGTSGSIAETQDDQTSAASGTVEAPGVSGVVAETQDDHTAAAEGHLSYSGSIAETQDDQTLAASGTFTAAGFSGSVAATQDDDTLAASGVPFVRPFHEGFEAAVPDGTAITVDNTNFTRIDHGEDAPDTGTLEFDTAQAVTGSASGLFTSLSTDDSQSYGVFFLDDGPVQFLRFYIMPITHATFTLIVQLKGLSAVAASAGGGPTENPTGQFEGVIGAQLVLNGGRQIRLRDQTQANVDGTAMTALPVGEWARIEMMADTTNDVLEVRQFTGANVHGTTPSDSRQFTSYTFVPDAPGWYYGQVGLINFNNNDVDAFDEIATSAIDWLGPVEQDVTGAVSVDEADDTLAASGTVTAPVAGTVAETSDDQTLAATGTFTVAEVTGTVAETQDDQTLAASGSFVVGDVTGVVGTPSVFQADAFQSDAFQGYAPYVQDDQTSTASGTVTVAGVSGSGTPVAADDTAAAEGTLRTLGTIDAVQEDDSVVAGGVLGTQGSVDATQSDNTLTATGLLSQSGSVDVTQGDQTLQATGSLSVPGAILATQDDQELTASGTSFGAFTGDIVVVEEDDLSSVSGQLQYDGAVDATQDDQTAAAAGNQSSSGSIAASQDDQTAAATGHLSYVGSISVTEEDDAPTIVASIEVFGTVELTQAEQVATATGFAVGLLALTDQATFVDTPRPDQWIATVRPTNWPDDTTRPDPWVGTLRQRRFVDSQLQSHWAGDTERPDHWAETARQLHFKETARTQFFSETVFVREGVTVALTKVDLGPYTQGEVPEPLVIRVLRTHRDGTTSGMPLHAQTPLWTGEVFIDGPDGDPVISGRAIEILDPADLTTEYPDEADLMVNGEDGWIRVAFLEGDLDQLTSGTSQQYGIQVVLDNGTLRLKSTDVWVPEVNTGPAAEVSSP